MTAIKIGKKHKNNHNKYNDMSKFTHKEHFVFVIHIANLFVGSCFCLLKNPTLNKTVVIQVNAKRK